MDEAVPPAWFAEATLEVEAMGFLADADDPGPEELWRRWQRERGAKPAPIAEVVLARIGLENLAQLVNERPTRVQPYGNIFAVVMGGGFEASLILVDYLWDEQFRQFVGGDYAVAVPAGDVLALAESSVRHNSHSYASCAFPRGCSLAPSLMKPRRRERRRSIATCPDGSDDGNDEPDRQRQQEPDHAPDRPEQTEANDDTNGCQHYGEHNPQRFDERHER